MTDTPELPEKMDLSSMDVAAEKREQLRQCLAAAFPEVMAEDRIDFDQLKRVLGEWVEPDRERFGLNWPGKADCMKVIQAPSIAALKPCPEESVDWDTTENLFIEGDNLEVLKLLQKAYFGKIKMIYIDPPYNTGKEFIYPDKYSETLDTYLEYTGQKDGDGHKFSTNTDASGRFHSRWLNMMYPRLYLAKNLLREDGVVFVSIDDNESANLKIILDQAFGEENHLGTIIWKNSTDNNPTNIAVEHEYIHVYSKGRDFIDAEWKSIVSDVKDVVVGIGNEMISNYNNDEIRQEKYSIWFRENKGQISPLDRYKFIDGKGVYTGSQSVHNPGKEGYRYDVVHPETKKPCRQPLMGYRFPEDTMKKLIDEGRIIFGEDENKIIELKTYAKDFKDKLSSIIEIDGRLGSYDLNYSFPEMTRAFTNPKPVRLIGHILPYILKEDDVVLDFFSGSCSTAHAVFDTNKKDAGLRRFIMVQLPEPCDENSAAAKAGFKTIADIGKERIRRVSSKIREEQAGRLDLEGAEQDLGFRVFKLSRSSFKAWDGQVDDEQLKKQLEMHVEHIDAASSPEDILYELLLKDGFPLTTPVEKLEIAGKEVFSIADGMLLICLEPELTEELMDGMAEMEPARVVCLDAGFRGNDQLKANAVQTFKARARNKETAIEFRTV